MKRTTEIVIILVIFAVAGFFRLYRLADVPAAIAPDEALNGNLASQAFSNGILNFLHSGRSITEDSMIFGQAITEKILGASAWALRLPAVLAGLLTVLGLYLLVRILFNNWEIAALSAFFLSVSSWHVIYSRLGISAVFAPLFLTWGAFLFWHGLSRGQTTTFILGGISVGLGMYSSSALALTPLFFLITALAYRQAIKKDFAHTRYLTSRIQILKGLGWFFFALFAVASPLVAQLAQSSVDTAWWFSDISFQFTSRNIPLLFWPVQVLAAFGFIRSFVKFLKQRFTHGHFSTVHTFLLFWFLATLGPALVMGNMALLWQLAALPVLCVFAAEGLWWLVNIAEDWYYARDVHLLCAPGELGKPRQHALCARESVVMVVTVLILFLSSLAIAEYHRYFVQWASDTGITRFLSSGTARVLETLSRTPDSITKYVVLPALYQNGTGPTTTRGQDPLLAAQSLMFLTQTFTPEQQKAKNLSYLTREQYEGRLYHRGVFIIPFE